MSGINDLDGYEALIRRPEQRRHHSYGEFVANVRIAPIVAVDFEKSIVWIKWIGTHRDYDKVDVREVRHGGD
ncbi:hypothetical protein ABIB90_000293 [Bradyrhizobium sp. JR4.1]|jgi:hypothetical protein|uniref:type II toxin-antitoxin system HigB family toxin n=1 Tax=unclassified Bradyrhizobium TaxID=2631580 RepID=UPI00025D21E5|nr:type II toxin-antitoxin system HigB family toxin [Bradyrhizobium sp. WSM1253]EIG59687.1 hypothetical protein Bra1253DRAFT_04436 [Bradyrhizobium sp. WSM1253]